MRALLLAWACVVVCTALLAHDSSKKLTKFAFGSCNKQDRPQPLWPDIIDFNPNFFLWLGDIVYADYPMLRVPAGPDRLRESYAAQAAIPAYKALVEKVPILGIWDDHDYGMNDGNKNYEHKVAAQQILLDFLEVPADSPRRSQEGVYTSYTFGPKGQRTKIILMDGRYHQERPRGDGKQDVLGAVQWKWLERELTTDNDADVVFLGTGVQVLSVGKPIGEGWNRFPTARRRLLELIGRSASPVVLLTGDVHFAELTRTHVCSTDAKGTRVARPVYDLTSSGMTHAWGTFWFLPKWIADFLLEHVVPCHDRFPSKESFSTGFNYGGILIDWETKSPTITLQVRGVNGSVDLEFVTTLDQLRGLSGSAMTAAEADCATTERLAVQGPPYHISGSMAVLIGAAAVILFIATVCVCCGMRYVCPKRDAPAQRLPIPKSDKKGR